MCRLTECICPAVASAAEAVAAAAACKVCGVWCTVAGMGHNNTLCACRRHVLATVHVTLYMSYTSFQLAVSLLQARL
jgi:hypothetical protein